MILKGKHIFFLYKVYKVLVFAIFDGLNKNVEMMIRQTPMADDGEVENKVAFQADAGMLSARF